MTDTANHESYTQAAETVADSVKQAFQPVTDAFKNFQTLEVPEAARDFVKRAAGTAKDRFGNQLAIKVHGPVEPYIRPRS